ncbi:MAG: PorT family protein [Chitinophagaceae bacterium]|nr:PorT family protein [Chitinophagaceae bacterium]
MKKFFFVIVSVISVSFVNAQTSFGIKGGVNLSTTTGDNSEFFSSAIGAYFGGMAKFPIDSKFSIQTEGMLSFEGAKFSVNGATGKTSATYARFPVLGQYHAGAGFTLQSGPELGLLMGATLKVTNGGSTSIKDAMKSTDFAWAFGVSFVPNKSKVGMSLRYNLGLSNINSDSGPANRTSVWQIGTFITL